MQIKDLQLKRALRSVLFILLLCLAGMTKMYAYDFSAVCETGQTLYYNIIDSTNHYVALICPGDGWAGYSKPTGDIILPENVQYEGVTYTITSIGNYAFQHCSGLTGGLTIPNSVTTIGSSAFQYCSGFTGSLTIPNSVTTIGDYAFYGCSGFTGNLTIPNSVTSIGEQAFSNCQGFTGSLTIGNSVTSIGYRAFYGCSGFTGSLTIPNSVTTISYDAFSGCSGFTGSLTIGNSVTTIGPSAFSGCSGFTGSLTIPNSVTSIGSSAFSGCSGFTGSLTIPNSVTTISYDAFSGCSGFTGNLTIPNSVTSIGSSAFSGCSGFNGNLTIGNSVTEIGNGVFSGCSGFTGSLTIPNSVTTIGGGAFFDCSGFTGSLTIGNSVTAISNGAFSGCSGFTEVIFNATNCADVSDSYPLFQGFEATLVIGNNVERIPAYMCYNCSGLTGSLTIPNSVTSIGRYAFFGCSGFTGGLTIGNSVTEIGRFAFYGCGFTGSLTIPNSVTTISDVAFADCGFTGNLTIGNSVTTIGGSAFQGCSGFTGSLTIPNSVTTIGGSAFYGCGFTGNLIIPNSVTTIDYEAFYGCSGFTGSLTIPNSVTLIGSRAFQGCSSFTGSLTIPNSVTTIGELAFYGCSGFNGNLNIGNSVTEIGKEAFHGCNGFTGSLIIGNSVSSINTYAFKGCSGFTGSLTIPNSVTAIGGGAFFDCSGFTGSLTIGNSVTTIGYQAFNGCSGFTGILTIPNSVTTIGYQAFNGCSGFTGNLIIPNSVTSIGSSVFNNCSGFTEVIFNATNCADVSSPSPFKGCEATLVIGNNVERLPAYMFCNCSGLTGSLTIPNSVTSIGESAFSGCSGFTGSLTIGNSVTTIGSSAFKNCSGFTGSLTIGNLVTSIEYDAFYGCSGFTEITSLAETPPSIGSDAFYYVNHSIPITVPCGTISAYQNASGWSQFTNYLEDCSLHITASANPVEGGTVTGAGSFEEGNTCTLVATPNQGYLFENWTKEGNIVSTSPTYSFTVTENATYVANFNLIPYEIIATASPMEGGSVIGSGTYNHFDTCTLVATPNQGYFFENWTKNGNVVSTNPTYSFIVTESASFIANFTLNVGSALNVSTHNINFGEVALNQSASATLNVEGVGLENNLNVEITGEDAAMFSFTQSTNWNSLTGGDLNITFMPTSVQYDYHANLIVSSGTLSQTVALSGSIANVYDFNTYVDEDVYAMNTSIPIHGTVKDIHNVPIVNVEVEIGIFVMGMKRTLQATTNASGEFSVTFEPIPSESGYYTVNSGRVGNNSTDIHDHFNIPGVVVVAEGYILCAVTQNQPKTDTIQLRNKSSLPLNINEVSVLSAPEGCSISFLPLSLDSMEIGNLIYTVNGTILTQGNYYQEIKLRVNSDEGATTDFSIWYYCMEPRGILNVTPRNITTTMTKGKSKTIDVMVSNHGTGPTGEITINLPSEAASWMSLVGSNTLPSLAVNDSAYFSLRLSPDNNILLTQFTGNIAVNCTHGEYVFLPYNITAVSDSTGSLSVDVTDEYSNYTVRGPHLANAEVTLTGYFSHYTVAGHTNANGTFNVENLPEGYYRLHVKADNHDEYDGIIFIDAGMTNQQDIFISYHAVTYSWTVVPGEIQDEYEFILNTTFETNVPAPVITIDAPERVPDTANIFNFNYIIVNHGLIDAHDIVLYTPEDEDFLFNANFDYVDTIHAQDTILIPCTVTRLPNNTSICKHWVCSKVSYNYTSGSNTIYKSAHDYTLVGTESCGSVTPPPSHGGGGGGAPGFAGGWGGGSGSPSCYGQYIPVDTPSGSVTVQVKVQFNQQLVMTREAFFGTFSVHNGYDMIPLQGIGLNFIVKDGDGNDCTNLFQIDTLELKNITSIDDNGALDPGSDGTAQIVFIPTREAAPTEPKDYYFGGTFTFYDPYYANTLVCDLYPVQLTVHPSPNLYVDYFMQRDILGDDALTEDIVEPSVPAELGVIINNKGAGIAKNVTLESAEPVMVDNAQGLLINFSMYGASFNGNEAQLGLNAIPFGNIESGHTAVGEWLFTSSLLGHFVSYEAHVIHNNSYDNPNLSLIGHLDIHELIHPIRAYGSLEDGINDFLVNDVPDNNDYPDSIYFSNGGRTGVGIINNISCDGDVTPLDTIVTLTVNPSRVGWNYGVVNDPGSDYVLVSCRRNHDNQNIPLSNVWQTFVTLHDGSDPLYENKLHIVDTVSSTQTVTYTLTYSGTPIEPSHTPIGAIDGLFSVNDSLQVYFSQGNLQYIGSASTPYWKFADNQWDYLGTTTGQNSSSQNVDRDLFGWGTSGYNHGAVCYQPWSTSQTNSDYYAYGSYTYNLYDQTGQADWGYNPISNGGNQINQWRTLTHEEWSYVLNTRTTPSGIRYAKAQVNGVNGVILLPDNWSSSIYNLNNTNSEEALFSSNIINRLQWDVLEIEGAVFLPVAGKRIGISIDDVGSEGRYSSASCHYANGPWHVVFHGSGLGIVSYLRCNGESVRLVRTVQDNASYSINTTSSPEEGGTVTGAGTYTAGETCTLTATANSGYTFTNWTENGNVVSTDANYTFTVMGNRNLVANFTYNGGGTTHEYVDLGLPSGTLWATCNVGANTPEGYGDYFAWGETQPKDTYNWSTYQYCMGSSNTLTKYCNNSSYGYNGFTDDLFILQTIDDAATVNWGSNWRMPTKEEWQELYQNTTVTWTTQNNVNGRLFTAANGNSVFLPASGVYMDGSLFGLDNDGNYWSSSLYFDNSNTAWGAYFGSNYYNLGYGPERNSGRSVRAVRSTGNTPTGAIKGIFSVSDSKQVLFSQGNLQFQASTSTWRFAEHQWDCLRLENANVSSTYDGWIDLFGWGTSGYNHGAVCYQPWSTSTNGSDYYAYGSSTYNLYDQTGQADWGYNAIINGGNAENQWRTLKSDEWSYLFFNRDTPSGIRFAKAIVNNVEGLVVLPDNWDSSIYGLNNTDNTSVNYSTNIISEDDWSSVLEPHGVLFLPAGSYRSGTSYVENWNPFKGYYWASSYSDDWAARYVEFNDGQLFVGNRSRNHGLSVRLVKTIQNTAHFIIPGNWSEASNWSEGALPSANDMVFIDAPCQLDTDAEVADLTISDGQSLTILSGKTLAVNGALTNISATGLVIEDSAQLIHNNTGVQATVKETIAGYGTSEDKWYFITNPITDSIIPSADNGLLLGNYDLYYCYPTSSDRLEWRNYKSDAFALHNGKGYLYANETGTELSFGGTLAPSHSSVMRTVYYEENNNSPGNGWTFLGNPFACNCYLVDANGNPLTIYKMNTDGAGLVEVLSGPIAPFEGFFYYTTETHDVYFSRTVPTGLSK